MTHAFDTHEFTSNIESKSIQEIESAIVASCDNIVENLSVIVACARELLRRGRPVPLSTQGVLRHAMAAAKGRLNEAAFLKYWNRPGLLTKIGSLGSEEQSEAASDGYEVEVFDPNHAGSESFTACPSTLDNTYLHAVFHGGRIRTVNEQKQYWASREAAKKTNVPLQLSLSTQQWDSLNLQAHAAGVSCENLAMAVLTVKGETPGATEVTL